MAVCVGCGTENREKARFRLGCAKPLAAVAPAAPVMAPLAAVRPAPGPTQTCPVCRSTNPLAATVCTSCRGSLVPDVVSAARSVERPVSRALAFKALSVLGLGLLAAASWWWSVSAPTGDGPALASARPVARTATPPLSTEPGDAVAKLSAAFAPAKSKATPAAAAAVPSAREKTASEDARAKRRAAAQAGREQAAGERAEAEGKSRLAKAQEQQRSAEAASQRASEQAAQFAVTAKVNPPSPLPVVQTVEQNCASSGNFFSREACRLRSCGDAALASDPVCVRFREMEAVNWRAVTN